MCTNIGLYYEDGFHYSDPDDVTVVVGEHDLTITESTQKECEVSQIIVHPQYDSWELR